MSGRAHPSVHTSPVSHCQFAGRFESSEPNRLWTGTRRCGSGEGPRMNRAPERHPSPVVTKTTRPTAPRSTLRSASLPRRAKAPALVSGPLPTAKSHKPLRPNMAVSAGRFARPRHSKPECRHLEIRPFAPEQERLARVQRMLTHSKRARRPPGRVACGRDARCLT
jgi:hypothetical protein